MGRPVYCTRSDVSSALDVAATPRVNAQIDRAMDAGARSIDGLCHRVFYPTAATRSFDYPPRADIFYRLWLDASELITLTSLTSNGVNIPTANVILGPTQYGPPYNRIDINYSTSSAFTLGNTYQQVITATGLWGYDNVTASAGALAGPVTDTTGTTITVDGLGLLSPGDLITIDSERMQVTGQTWSNTAVAYTGCTTANKADNILAVPNATLFAVGDILRLDYEHMYVSDFFGNNLVVKRAYDGTILATHTPGTVYAQRALTVTRAATGTTAATHLTGAPIARQSYPGEIRSLNVALALNQLGAEQTGYQVVQERSNRGNQAANLTVLQDLRMQVAAKYVRKARTRVVA